MRWAMGRVRERERDAMISAITQLLERCFGPSASASPALSGCIEKTKGVLRLEGVCEDTL